MIKNAPLVDFDGNDLAKLTRPAAKRELFPIPKNERPLSLPHGRANPMLLAMAVSHRAQAAPKKATPNWTAENRHYALLHFLAGFGSRGAQIQEILRHLAERTGTVE